MYRVTIAFVDLLSIVILPAAQSIRQRRYLCNASKFFGSVRCSPSALNLFFQVSGNLTRVLASGFGLSSHNLRNELAPLTLIRLSLNN